MRSNVPDESKLDIATARLLEDIGQRVSRRGLLSRVAKLLLGAVGFSAIPHLPLDRSFIAEAQGSSCCFPQACGMNGSLCNSCCGNSGSLTGCPNCAGMTVGNNSWSKCCSDPAICGSGLMVTYRDCCTPNQSDAQACKGSFCGFDPSQPSAWCSGTGLFYSCTIIEVGGACSPATDNPC